MAPGQKKTLARLDSLSVLGDALRRRIYVHLLDQKAEASRDQVARALGITRSLAAFHLDRLAAAGLLTVSYRRLSGRTGPGAGRPSKLYRPSSQQVDAVLPAPQPSIAAKILARAMEEGESAEQLERAARSYGREIGRGARERASAETGEDMGSRSLVPPRHALQVLSEAGFQPTFERDGKILLHRCPFDAASSPARVPICRMNLALCRGLLEGLEAAGWNVTLEPAPGHCCAVFQTAGA